jgi:hypothetical protein
VRPALRAGRERRERQRRGRGEAERATARDHRGISVLTASRQFAR